MGWMNDLKRGLQQLSKPMQPRAERRTASSLAARLGSDSASTPAGIKDISASGIYMFTGKRLPTGELITLTLEEKGASENSSEHKFSVDARVARQGKDGIGLSFVLPPGLDSDLWGVLVRNIVVLTNRDQIAHMFRTLRTFLFVCRLCQSGAEEALALLGGELDSNRTATVVNMALATENLLASEADADRMRAHPKLVANILREGSWAPDDLTKQLWTGLLISSCSVNAPDDSNQIFVNLLIHVTPIQARILCHACERAKGSAPGAGNSPSDSVVLNPEEMIALTGVYDLTRNATDLAYLFNLGLIQRLFDFTSYHAIEGFDVTPSNLGIALYKHCHGSREMIEPDLVESANAHLLTFLPPPQPVAQYQNFFIDGQNPPSPPSSSGR